MGHHILSKEDSLEQNKRKKKMPINEQTNIKHVTFIFRFIISAHVIVFDAAVPVPFQVICLMAGSCLGSMEK